MQKTRSLIILLFYILAITTTLYSDSFYKTYNKPSGLINYTIQGEGNATQNSHFEINGRASLVFREWGAINLYKERYKEVSTGIAKKTLILKTLILKDYGTIYEVNFDKEEIRKRVDPIIKEALESGKDLSNKFTKKAKLVGHSTILGYPCEEWQYKGRKQCLYNGIVLKEELTLLNINIFKVATNIEFDKNITDDQFTLPTFLENESKGFLLKDKAGLTTQSDIAIDKDEPEDKKNSIIAKELITELFLKQKDLLPQLLIEMQEARVCLENAENKEEANFCLNKVLKIKENITGEIEENCKIDTWIKEAREQRLEIIEEKIWIMKREMPCIRRSQNIADLSICMEEGSN